MSLDELTGRRYGPVQVQIHTGQVGAYVEATGDDPDRWRSFAPPSFAGALLFAVAPAFLADPIVVGEVGSVLHGEQTFTWHHPLEIGQPLSVTGSVERVRSRGGVGIIVFGFEVVGAEPVVQGRSTFVVSTEAAPTGEDGGEPDVAERGRNERASALEFPAAGAHIEPLIKSASRADLVRYAGASHDWNPIHWDHASAVAAGLEGVIVHGLLSAAWVTQAVARYVPGGCPIADARFRFRTPLRPGVETRVVGGVIDDVPGRFRVALQSDTGTHVTADLAVTR
ncbi:MAG: hypothetical protein GWP04_11265 [Gammaproteobacteria bacterium]|nr:hypothetical protein [Gammaproteobacteria bacterium]